MGVLRYDEVFKRRIRAGDWQDQLISTYQKIRTSIEEQRIEDAMEYIAYFDDEAVIIYDLYHQWITDTRRFLKAEGLTDADLEGVQSDLLELVNHYVPGGKPYDRAAEWAGYQKLRARLIRQLRGPAQQALETCAAMKEQWRSVHDRDVDYISGLFNTVHIRLGEAKIEQMYREHVIGHLFNFRYERFDVSKHSWDKIINSLLYVSIEAMRGHLVGPNREGDMELTEHDDRWVLRFQPCGSGGRTVRGEPLDGTFSRMEAPYFYQVLQEKHDWAWNKAGVCHYCAHCSILMEKLPMERFGYPVRVVDPPTYPDQREQCQWTIFKRLEDIPEEIYARMGEQKPAKGAPLGSGGDGHR